MVEIQGVELLHTLKHRVQYVSPSGSEAQRDKLEEYLAHNHGSGDPVDENGHLGRVICVGALVKIEGQGNEGGDAGLQRVV